MAIFGHLKAEEFINLIEGGELPLKQRTHLQSCAQCTEAFVSSQSFHAEISKSAATSALDDQELPEPDWFQFRADVRNAMLSRAAQRQSKPSSWTGWFLRPAMTWGLAVAFTAGLSAGLLIWNRTGTPVPTPQSESAESVDSSAIAEDASLETAIDSNLSSWSQTSVFEELSQLDDDQAEKLQRLLEADLPGGPVQK